MSESRLKTVGGFTAPENPIENKVNVNNDGTATIYNRRTKKSVDVPYGGFTGDFVIIDQLFFLDGMPRGESARFKSTPYRKTSDEVKIFKNDGRKWEIVASGPKRSPAVDAVRLSANMSTKMSLIAMNTKTKKFIEVVLSASIRSVFMNFTKGYREGHFSIKGYEEHPKEITDEVPLLKGKIRPIFEQFSVPSDMEQIAGDFQQDIWNAYWNEIQDSMVNEQSTEGSSVPVAKATAPTSDEPAGNHVDADDDLPF